MCNAAIPKQTDETKGKQMMVLNTFRVAGFQPAIVPVLKPEKDDDLLAFAAHSELGTIGVCFLPTGEMRIDWSDAFALRRRQGVVDMKLKRSKYAPENSSLVVKDYAEMGKVLKILNDLL